MESYIYHLPDSHLPDPFWRHIFALRMANLHLALALVRRLQLDTPELMASWEAFLHPHPAYPPMYLDDWPMKWWPMKWVNNLGIIMETWHNISGPPIFATEEDFPEPWAMYYLAAAMTQTWTWDPLGRISGEPQDVSIEELKRLTEEVYEEVRKVNVDIWEFNYAYHWQIVEQRWFDKQTGSKKECYDGGHQNGIGHEESVENGERDDTTNGVEDDVEDTMEDTMEDNVEDNVEDAVETGVQDEMVKEVRNDKNYDSGYFSMKGEVWENCNNADDDDDTSSDDEVVLTPSTESDVRETECRQEREWPRELVWHPEFGPCPEIDRRTQDADKVIAAFRGSRPKTDCRPM